MYDFAYSRPGSVAEAVRALGADSDAKPLAGGQTLIPVLKQRLNRPSTVLDLSGLGLDGVRREGDRIVIGAMATHRDIAASPEVRQAIPGLAKMARLIGDTQVRHRGTIGGSLANNDPSACYPAAVLALGGTVRTDRRSIAAEEFFQGMFTTAPEADELITAVWVRPATGPQQFSKIGTRNAMVIAVAAFGLALHPDQQRVAAGIGSAAPTPRRASAAEAFVSAELDWASRGDLARDLTDEFGRLVATAAAPIDDVRGTAAYRRHALSVMARRCLGWAWTAHQRGEHS